MGNFYQSAFFKLFGYVKCSWKYKKIMNSWKFLLHKFLRIKYYFIHYEYIWTFLPTHTFFKRDFKTSKKVSKTISKCPKLKFQTKMGFKMQNPVITFWTFFVTKIQHFSKRPIWTKKCPKKSMASPYPGGLS